MTKDFYKYDLHDSVIEKIEINCNNTVLHIDCDGLKLKITCRETVGIEGLCMWEDDVISGAWLGEAEDFELPFLKNIKNARPTYGKEEQNPVRKGLLDLSVELANDTFFHVYCYCVDVENNFPDTLDGAKVFFWAQLPEKETLYYEDGGVWAEIAYYAICKYKNLETCYLFKCDGNFEVRSDWDFLSENDCKNVFGGEDLNWISK